MSIASELNNYRNGLDDAWDAAADMGATIPADRNMVNLDDAIRTIPVSSPNDGVLTITQNGTTIQTFSADQSTNVTAALTDTTYSAFTGATSSVAGSNGLVPGPAAGDQEKVLHGDGTWKDTTAKLVEMSYGESNAWAKFIAAYNAGSIVYCRASSNSNPGTGSQTRKAFMAYVNNAASPTNVEFQYVRSQSSKTDSQQTDQVFVYTLTNSNGGTWSVASRNMGPKINVSGPITKTFTTGANATITIGADAMTGATSSTAGAAGVVPKPNSGDQDKFLKGDGTWGDVFGSETTSSGQTAWKFPDGKMICFGTKTDSYAITGSYEGSYYAGTGSNLSSIFAESFISAPVVTVTVEQNSSLITFDLTSVSTTGFGGWIWGQYSKKATVGVHYMAIGRWK